LGANSQTNVVPLRIPPHSIEAERAILGALLFDPSAYRRVGALVAADFYVGANAAIYTAVQQVIAAGDALDIVSLWDRLEGEVVDFGGLPYLSELAAGVASAAHLEQHVEIVRHRAALRETIALADRIQSAAFEMPRAGSVPALLTGLAGEIGRVQDAVGGRGDDGIPIVDAIALRDTGEWLVRGMIPTDSLGIVFGASGCYKSFVVLDLACHVAHGLRWAGKRTRRGQVLYIAAEGQGGIRRRIEAWHRARGLQIAPGSLFVLPRALDLGSEARRVVEAARGLGVDPALVVVDTLSQTYAGEENSANEVAAYLRELGHRMREAWRCAIAIVHHSGHSETERPRGSSALRANVDWMFGVFRDADERLATLTCDKSKDSDTSTDVQFALTVEHLGVDEEGDPVTSLVARHLRSAEDVSAAMETESRAGRGGRRTLLLALAANGMREAELRKAFYEECDITDSEARKKAYYRAREWAVKNGMIEIVAGYVLTRKGTE
jgi:KaiC/GvpD/RAD55 family RecA-like ATPase